MQQPPSSLPPPPYCYPQPLFNQDGGGTANHQWLTDNNKPNQFPIPWDNNGAFHVTTGGNTYGPSQVQGGGGQNRVQVGPQQPQQPSQPTPTSTPPSIHGDMNKQPLMANQPNPMTFVQTRALNPSNFAPFSRGAMAPQPPQHRTHSTRNPQIVNFSPMSLQGVLAPAPTQTIVQAVQYPAQLMYQQQRQGGPYSSGLFVPTPQTNFYTTQQYYPTVMPPTYQGMSSGGPSPQAGGQQQPVQMMRQQVPPVAPPVKPEAKKLRPNAIKIIDPNTYEEVAVDTDSTGNNNNVTPTRSNDSSARETPQPNAGAIDNALAAEFAARVAARAMASEPQSPPSDQVQDSISSDSSDVHHKQHRIVVLSSEKMFNTVLSTKSEEFIPRSHKQAQLCEPTIEELRVPVVPTVSAETNSPAIDIPRPKEQFPALKNPMPAPSAPVVQSPLKVSSKKPKGGESDRQQVTSIPPPAQAPPPPAPIDNKDNTITNKKGQKSVQKEEVIALPKEKREKTRSLSKEQSPSLSPVTTSAVSTQPEIIAVPVIKSPPVVSASTIPKDAVKTNNVSLPTSSTSVEDPPAGPFSKVPQHQNGEALVAEPPTVSVEGNKSTRPKNKKSGKMRDMNRRGVEKEGSDMDAFTTEPTIMAEDRDRPETPVSPPPKIPPTPPAAIEPVAPLSPVDKIKEDLEEKEDTLVAAKNEENAKVSALGNKAEEEPSAPVEKTVPQLTLKRSYKKDQWSPLNQEGKKKYDRDFLMELKQEPQSQVKPENLPDVVAVLKDSNNMRNQNNMTFMLNRDMNMIMPPFTQRGSQSQRGQLITKRGSQQGNKGGKGNPKVIHMSLSLHEDVKLKTAENAWKPTRLVPEAEKNEDEKQNEEVYKSVRSILNKLTPQKFETLMKKFLQIPINSETRLVEVIRLIFEKAVDEPNFSKAYANMCKLCSKVEVTKLDNGKEEKVNFRKILITRCQTEFERNKSEEVNSAKWMEDINNCSDPEKKKELQSQYEENERQIRRKSVGNIRFIGELFKLGMLTPAIMFRCIEHLLQTPQEESLECLCKLLSTIGKDLEKPQPNQSSKTQSLNPYFQRMADLAQKKESSKVSSRVRFMLQDVIELRQSNWVPRREDNNPKTIEQINKEAERESFEMTIALSNQPARMNRPNDRQDDLRKRGGNRANNNNSQNDDGWATVNSRHYHNKFAPSFDSNKMQSIAKSSELDLNNLNLGGSQTYRFSNLAKSVDAKPGASFASTNTFSALSRGDERKPPQSSINNRRITPTPSIERQRMIQGTMEREGGHSSRGSSAQRDRSQPSSQPPSRDSSMPRQLADNKEVTETNFKREEDKPERIMDEKSMRLAEEKLERQTNTILEEYLADSSSLEDVKQDIEQIYSSNRVGDFVDKSLQIALEKKAGAQRKIGILITSLMDYNVFSTEVLVEQLSLIYETADDFAIDVPKVWELQAQVIVPILAAEKMNFSHFKSACSSVLKTPSAPKLLLPVFEILIQEKGAGFVRKVWHSSDVSLKDFLPAETNLDAFIKENSLEYLTGDASSYQLGESFSNQLSMDQVQEKMLRLMLKNEPFDTILDFISSNVGDKVEDLHFIRALITAICEACISGPNYNLDSVKFKEYEKLIQRFIDNKEDRELACLNSVHILLTRLQHPQGLIMSIFNLFLEDNLICCESFLKWKEDEYEKLENKGVTLLSLRSFFSALQDVESEDENS